MVGGGNAREIPRRSPPSSPQRQAALGEAPTHRVNDLGVIGVAIDLDRVNNPSDGLERRQHRLDRSRRWITIHVVKRVEFNRKRQRCTVIVDQHDGPTGNRLFGRDHASYKHADRCPSLIVEPFECVEHAEHRLGETQANYKLAGELNAGRCRPARVECEVDSVQGLDGVTNLGGAYGDVAHTIVKRNRAITCPATIEQREPEYLDLLK